MITRFPSWISARKSRVWQKYIRKAEDVEFIPCPSTLRTGNVYTSCWCWIHVMASIIWQTIGIRPSRDVTVFESGEDFFNIRGFRHAAEMGGKWIGCENPSRRRSSVAYILSVRWVRYCSHVEVKQYSPSSLFGRRVTTQSTTFTLRSRTVAFGAAK